MKLDDKRVDWLYQKFQAVSKAHNNYLYLLLFVSAFSYIIFDGSARTPSVSIFGLGADRSLVLAGSALLGAWLIVAYCGNFDMGESILTRLAEVLGSDYEDLDLVDTHPNLFDYAQYARKQRVARRGVLARYSVKLLYPGALVISWFWFLFLALVELVDAGGLVAAKVMTLVTLVTLLVALARLQDFVSRRWRTLQRAEASHQQ